MSKDNETPHGEDEYGNFPVEDFDAYFSVGPQEPPHDPQTGEILQSPQKPTPESLGQPDDGQLNKGIQQAVAGIHAALNAIRNLEATKGNEESLQRVGTDVMNTQELVKKARDDLKAVHKTSTAVEGLLKEFETKLQGRDLEELKADLQRTIVNLNKAAEARITGKSHKFRAFRFALYTMFALSVLANVAVFGFKTAIGVYPEEVRQQIEECDDLVQRDNQAYQCTITMRP